MEIENRFENGLIYALCNLDGIPMVLKDNVVECDDEYENILVKDYIFNKTKSTNEKMEDSLKIVQLNQNVLNNKINNLSSSEKLKVEIAIRFINNDNMLVFNYLDHCFVYKEQIYLKKLLKKLVSKYNKTVILINSDINFTLGLVDIYFVYDKNHQIHKFTKDLIYDEKFLSLVDVPNIIDLIRFINKDGKKINEYVEFNELIKAIYREV